jgi:quinone-modifying oxidoreductase subunit QmoC
MVQETELLPSAEFRRKLAERGGGKASRCFQCATCSSVCELACLGLPFPRQQMLASQWGLADRLAGDPGVWLCHQCNDCNVSCPRDARPGDVMQSIRALSVEFLAAPRFLGKLVGNAGKTWPALLGAPIVLWLILLGLTSGFHVPEATNQKTLHSRSSYSLVDKALASDQSSGLTHVTGSETRLVYEEFVPHKLIYSVYFTAASLALLAIVISSVRFWKLLGKHDDRSGSFFASLVAVLGEIGSHKRFSSCEVAAVRRWAHFSLLWGFVGAAATSGLLIVAMYISGTPLPLAQVHPYKILGNLSAVLLLGGIVGLAANRLADEKRAGSFRPFDSFFLSIVVLVIVTGVLAEVGAFVMAPVLAVGIYLVHLGSVLCLFLTFPYSKFAHMVYRTLALVHERMAAPGTVTS